VPEPVGSPLGEPAAGDDDTVRWVVLQLGLVWDGFARRLAATPIIRRIESGTATVDDYRNLLLHLRQQVVDGGRWIARAASNFSADLFELRSAAIRHAAEEHRDFRLLERDYVAVGGDLATIQGGRQNVGSEALSAFLFHRASLPDPVDLLGAMFIIEGLGTACADNWARQLRDQLGLTEAQTTFLHYHGGADAEHFEMLSSALRSGVLTRARAERMVRTAAVTARLYALQLAAIDDE
jgi:3-oxoacyl-[acyl-carrier-protein] synthase-3